MRYYSIQISNGLSYTSHPQGPNGPIDPGNLMVELDIPISQVDVPDAGAYVTIWGPGLSAIAQTQNIFNQTITVRGGMGRGLPLANPAQSGELAQGAIYQAFGNWIGVEQNLQIVFIPGSNPPSAGGPNPQPPTKNITLNWLKGQPLQGALQQALQQAYPGINTTINISQQLIATQDQKGYYGSLEEFGYYLRRYSQQLMNPQGQNTAVPQTYEGVGIVNNNGKLNAFDGTKPGNTIYILFQDLIGQPTWIAPNTISFKTVMRADINPNDTVILPKTFANAVGGYESGIAGTQFQSGGSLNQLAFSGSFHVTKLRHMGNSRSPSAEAWVTQFFAYSNGAAQSSS